MHAARVPIANRLRSHLRTPTALATALILTLLPTATGAGRSPGRRAVEANMRVGRLP